MSIELPTPRDWQIFEDFCRDLFAAEWDDPEAQKHGRLGQEQHGVDVFGRRNGRWQAVQCKLRQRFPEKRLTERQVRAEVTAAKRFKMPLETLIIATTAPADTKLQALAMHLTEEHDDGTRIVIYGWSDLCEKLEAHDKVFRRWRTKLYEPTPSFSDEASRELAEALEAAQLKHEELTSSGQDPSPALEEILDIKRRLREGGQLQAGDLLSEGRFRLLEPIGRGGFATVFKAYDRQTQQLVAVKVLHGQYAKDRSRRDRFFRGARKMSELQHQGIVRVIESRLEDGGYHFFVMEYVDGGDLQKAVIEGRVTDLETLREIAEALDFAHQRGIVHRDVKPANILLTRDGRAKLTDFDLVRAFDTTGGTRTRSMLGTFLYMAPEAMYQAKDVSPAADVYSLAMTAAFTIHGEELPLAMVRNPAGFLARLNAPATVRMVLQHATSLEGKNRPATATGLIQMLEMGREEGRACPRHLEPVRESEKGAAAENSEETFGDLDAEHLERGISGGRGEKRLVRRNVLVGTIAAILITALGYRLVTALGSRPLRLFDPTAATSGTQIPQTTWERIILLVPEHLSFQNFLPSIARGTLEREVAYNLFGGLFNPQAGQGYSPGFAESIQFTDKNNSNTEGHAATVRLTRKPRLAHYLDTSTTAVDAYFVAEVWERILRDSSFPGRSIYTSAINDVRAIDEEHLRVIFRQPLTERRAREALSFRIFDPSTSHASHSSGPFILKIPSPRARHRDLVPMPMHTEGDRTRSTVTLRAEASSVKRLKEVSAGRAQVAMSIPIYLGSKKPGIGFHVTDRYNSWALVFGPTLSSEDRRELAQILNAEKLLKAFLFAGGVSDDYLLDLGLRPSELLSPSIFPSSYEVIECLKEQRQAAKLDERLRATARWLEEPGKSELPSNPKRSPSRLPSLKIAFWRGGYPEGTIALAEELKRQLDNNNVQAQISDVTQIDLYSMLPDLALGTSDYHAALVRFDYDSRCDVSTHFRHEEPSLQAGLFKWVTDLPNGQSLRWNSSALNALRDADTCSEAVGPVLEVARAVYDIAPAKFLFTVPDLMVFDRRLIVEVNEDFALADMKNWRPRSQNN